jgi:ribosomal protein L19
MVVFCIIPTGLGSTVTLRNVENDVAIEKQYHIYSPLIKEIKVCGD